MALSYSCVNNAILPGPIQLDLPNIPKIAGPLECDSVAADFVIAIDRVKTHEDGVSTIGKRLISILKLNHRIVSSSRFANPTAFQVLIRHPPLKRFFGLVVVTGFGLP